MSAAIAAPAALASFELNVLPIRAAFGDGQSAKLPERLQELAIARPLLIGTAAAETRYQALFGLLADSPSATFFAAEPHCPEPIVERCRRTYLDARCDGVVAIGGGSTLGLGKILAAEEGAKFIALPTTYSGSEMTPLFGRKIGTEKRVGRDPKCRPQLVIYDGRLTAGLPRRMAACSGMNSVAHAVEALYPQRLNPLAPLLAEQALLAHRHGLREIASGSPSVAALDAVQYGGFLGGVLVSMCGIALHHQLCHVLGGLFELPHGATNSVILPHAVAYNLPSIPEAAAVIERVFGGKNAAAALFDFATDIHAPQSLRDLGMPESGIEPTVAAILAHGGWNPRALERAGILELVHAAFEGRRP
jgi:alcohol dehydrogenase class IV